ncbi:MAG: hypothetical protein WC831_00025 [Parcubacteria group bacterium]|jgi:hypothetical protein
MHLGQYNNTPHRKFFWAFIVLVVMVAIFVANYTLARVYITIHPKIDKKSSEIGLTVDIKSEKPDFSNMILPGKIVESQGEITKKTDSVSEQKIEDFAKGTVKIKNIWKKDFFLQTGAQLVQGESPESVGATTKNIFILDHEVNVLANGEIDAAVTAKNKGAVGNIPRGKFYFLRMSKWNRERIWAENTENFSGGEKIIRIATQDDINRAFQAAAEELGKKEIEKMTAELETVQKISPGFTRVEIMESRASIEPKTETENFEVTVKGKVSTIVYNEKDLREMAIERFKNQIGSSQEIESIDEGSIKYELTDISGNDGKANVKITIPAILMAKLPSKILEKKSIVGYNGAALQERYAKFPEISSIDVKFFPFWIKSVPNFESQIGFEIKAE